MRASSAARPRRFPPLVAVLILLSACLCLATAELASSSSGSADSTPVVGDDSLSSDDAYAVDDSNDGAVMDKTSDSDNEEEEEMVLTPIPTAAVGSTTFALVDSVTCDTETVDTIESICSINRALFDTCVAASGYQIFPYSGVVPDADDITGLVTSESCMGFITAVVLLNMPACTVAQMPLRAVCETLLKISVDVENGEAAPDAEEFHAEMVWRRDSDLAKQAGAPYDNSSAIYTDFTRNLRVALTESKVTVLSNLTILIEDYEGEEIDMADGAEAAFDTSLAADSGVGTVEAADDSDDQVDASTVSESSRSESGSGLTSVSALTSGAPTATSVSMAALAVVVAHALL